MPIDRFNTEQFEAALPRHKQTGEPLCICNGLVGGERTYTLPVGGDVFVRIRSSIDYTGVASDTGENSIRLYIVNGAGAPLANKLNAYVTRVPGWQKRIGVQLRELYKMGLLIVKPCSCGAQRHVFIAKKIGVNRGRKFTKCPACGDFKWIVEGGDSRAA